MSLQVTCGDRARCLHVQTARFTLIGATTAEDRLPAPMLSRFCHAFMPASTFPLSPRHGRGSLGAIHSVLSEGQSMKGVITATVLAALLAVPAFAGSSVTVTPLRGDLGPLSSNHDATIAGYLPTGLQPGALPGLPANLYDYVPTWLGGQASTLVWGPFSIISGRPAVLDWTETGAFGDDVQLVAGTGTAVVTKIHYGYANTVASATHIIRIYDMVPGGLPVGASPVTMGSLLASIVLPSMPLGTGVQFVTWETAAGIALPESFWIAFDEGGAGAPDTFWLSGTSEGQFGDIAPGFSQVGLLFLDPGAPPYPYGYWGRGIFPGFDLYLYMDDPESSCA